MMESGTSLADLAAVSNMNSSDGFGGNGGWLWFLIVMFALFNGGFGYGGNSTSANVATDSINASMQRGFDNQNVMMRFDTLSQNQSANAYDNAALIAANKYDNAMLINNNTMATVNAGNNIIANQTAGFNSVTAGINDLGYQVQSTACATNRNIDSVKYENAQNTCAITNAIHQEAEMTRGLIQQNIIQDLRDRLEDKDRLYQAANFQISQNAQTSNILDSLGRWVSNPPQPIYTTPYYGTTYGTTIS